MTEQHPITPPPELVTKWASSMCGYYEAARWGADEELEACCEWLDKKIGAVDSCDLRAARRPNPPSLNEVALQMLGTIERDAHYIPEITDTIRRALEALDD